MICKQTYYWNKNRRGRKRNKWCLYAELSHFTDSLNVEKKLPKFTTNSNKSILSYYMFSIELKTLNANLSRLLFSMNVYNRTMFIMLSFRNDMKLKKVLIYYFNSLFNYNTHWTKIWTNENNISACATEKSTYKIQ